MADEAQVRSSLTINKDKLSYSGRPTSHLVTITTAKGPSPGAFDIALTGTDVDLSELATPALVRLQNLSTTDYVEYGIWDATTETFYPLGEILAGESYVFRLSRNLNYQYGTSTGTTGADDITLRFRATVGNVVVVVVDAFDD